MVTAITAQEIRPSESAYYTWKNTDGKALSADGQCRIVMSFASRVEDNEKIKAEVTVATTGSLSQLPAMSFTVQPLMIVDDLTKGAGIVEMASPGTLEFPARNPASPISGIFAKPMITTQIPQGANAVRISVKGFSGDNAISSVLALKDSTSSSVIAGPICRE